MSQCTRTASPRLHQTKDPLRPRCKHQFRYQSTRLLLLRCKHPLLHHFRRKASPWLHRFLYQSKPRPLCRSKPQPPLR